MFTNKEKHWGGSTKPTDYDFLTKQGCDGEKTGWIRTKVTLKHTTEEKNTHKTQVASLITFAPRKNVS